MRSKSFLSVGKSAESKSTAELDPAEDRAIDNLWAVQFKADGDIITETLVVRGKILTVQTLAGKYGNAVVVLHQGTNGTGAILWYLRKDSK